MRLRFLLSIAVLAMFSGQNVRAQTARQSTLTPESLNTITTEQLVNQATYAPEWERIDESQISWRRRVWQELHLMDPANAQLKNLGKKHETLAEALLRSASNGQVRIYASEDNNFIKTVDAATLENILADVPSGTIQTSVEKFLIKEDWILYFTGSKQHKLVSRIIGIAPVQQIVGKDGVTTEKTLCWFYFPNVRPVLRELTLNVSSENGFTNADELLEMRAFTSKVTRSKEMPLYPKPDKSKAW